MKIKVLFEVKDKATLREILITGKAQSLLDYNIINFEVVK